MKSISLNGTWRVRGRFQADTSAQMPAFGGEVRGRSQAETSAKMLAFDGEVPGCVQLDMSREGILPSDLFFGENILEAEKYEGYEWWYERTFIAPEERENVFLVFGGVDCIAEYFLNGERLGESKNMFIAHEFCIDGKLCDGENTVTVHITSPTAYSHQADYDICGIAVSWYATPTTPTDAVIRRAPHSYGWDIMPRAVTSGLWRDVTLECRDCIRFSQVFFDFANGRSQLCYTMEGKFSDFHDVEIAVEAHCGESVFKKRFPVRSVAGREQISIPSPKLWWPYGYGEANVYDATLSILRCGEVVHEYKTQFGIRSVELDRTDTSNGEDGRFRFLINGVEVMCKGSNWVPLDAFHSRDASRYERALALVRDIGCNILRCWGGNVYEDHAFFDFCDRNGIMVWQDFAMACNNYPQNEEFLREMEREATFVVRTYRHHPSIILWSGDNEIDESMHHFRVQPSMNRITREVLPHVVYRNDVGRPYLASSPYISDEAFYAKDGRFSPETHLWGPRDYHKSDFYKGSKHHFVSETGYHGCPSVDSIRKFISKDRVWPYTDNPEWILHSSDQKGRDQRVMLMDYQVRQFFGSVPTDIESFVLASQISQAEADKYFIERMRIGRPKKSGIIWWNLLDGWPQMSDAVVDYYFDKKKAYEYIKRSQSPLAVMLDELRDRKQNVCVCNDTLSDVTLHVTVTDSESDAVVFERTATVPKNATTVIGALGVEYSEKKMLIIRWECENGECGFNHYLTGFIPYSLDKYREWIEKYGL